MSNITEEWKEIIGYEGFYMISNIGNVKSLDRIVICNKKGNYLRKGKQLSKTIDDQGYVRVGFTLNSKTIAFKIHRLVADAFIPNPNNKPCINHIDGNKTNNYITNLERCTYSENSLHAVRTGLLNPKYPIHKGENNYKAILTEREVLEIRSKYIPRTYSASKLAREYNVSQSCITHILNKTSWKNVAE